MRMDQAQDGAPVPGTEAWSLPCGCWAWKWAGVESWILCQPHVMTHNTRKTAEFAMSYTGFGEDSESKRVKRICTCLICLAEQHGEISPFEYARLLVNQGLDEYRRKRQMDLTPLLADSTELLQQAQAKLLSDTPTPPPALTRDKMRCGCVVTRIKGEWRVTLSCKKHRTETKAARRRREDRENERRDA